VDAAVTAGNASAKACREAYALALGARGWEPMIEMGDAALRVARQLQRRA
jgi:hypothetical protein